MSERINKPQKRIRMRRRKAFSLLEILLSLAVVGVLFGLIFAFYRAAIERSKHVDAVATVDAISKAEEINQMNTGEYVAAASTQEVNEKLGMDIKPRWYRYKVIGVTDDDFIVLAEKILDDINDRRLNTEPTVIARNKSGPISPASIDSGDDKRTPSDGDVPSDTDNPSHDPGTSPGGGSPGGGSPGGGSPGGGPGGNPTDYPTGAPEGNPSQSGGGDDTHYRDATTVPDSVLSLLDGTLSGQFYYNLIKNNNIKVIYDDFRKYGADAASKDLAFWVNTSYNTIYVNDLLTQSTVEFGIPYTDTAIASIITHEANHADYSYHPQEWIAATKAAHPELTDSDIHITQSPYDSIDQEYQGFNAAVNVWNEIKGTDTNDQLDYWAGEQATGGEARMKADIKGMSGYDVLPDY